MKTETIGDRIRRKREAKGFTLFALSVAAGIREQNLRLWEGGRNPTATEIPALAKALGTSPNYLLTGKEQFSEART